MTWETYLEGQRERHQDELLEFLRIPSVSTLLEHAEDVQHAAHWVADRLGAAGLEHVRILPTNGHPVVYGDWLHTSSQITVLIYRHFDTQPADPLELWTTPPFQPTIRDGRVYVRGASDDKGNMLTPILAIEALLRSEGALPVNVKFFLEGQEEIGSPHIHTLVTQQRELFSCDLVISADGGQYSEDHTSLLVSCKGLAGAKIEPQTFQGVHVQVRPLSGSARPYLAPSDHWGNQIAQAVLTELYGESAYYTRSSGSIPACEVFLSTLGVYTVSFGLSDEQIHTPNEFFRLSSFRRGPAAYAKLLHRLRKQSL